ncbi:hypothetical protein GCM10017624_39050 [Azotobacter vinelandii]|nr:hypothetical protein GCM10017624_39050 [Azotobacter vinelandii]
MKQARYYTPTHITLTSRIARCGPACRVVWQGHSLTAAPYADQLNKQAVIMGCDTSGAVFAR